MFGATCDGRVVIADTTFGFHSAPPCWADTTYDSFVLRARMFAPLGNARALACTFRCPRRNQLCSIDETSSLSLKVRDGEDALASTRGACAPQNISGVCQFAFIGIQFDAIYSLDV